MKPPGGTNYHSSQQHFPYLPPLITTTATGRVKTCRVRDSHKDTVIGGQAQKESIMGGIIILLRPAPIVDPFSAWTTHLCHKDTAKGEKCLWVS